MIELLEKDFPSHYGLKRKRIAVPNKTTSDEQFDLTDCGDTMLVPYKTGNVSFIHSKQTEIQVICYEKFLKAFNGTAFETGRKRCDFILYESGGSGDGFFMLNERYKQLESRVTGENGAILQQPAINAEGFEYRRISHTYSFKLS